jgi:predicted nucleic acid-binding Zn ribbon protein
MTNKEQIIKLKSEGKSYREISSFLSIPLGTVKSTISTASRKGPHKCLNCGKEIPEVGTKRNKKFCSDKCRLKWWKEHPTTHAKKSRENKVCEYCGREFDAYSHKGARFCSRACYLAEMNEKRNKAR